jgi:opacity protein-like surface antigen
MRGNWFIASAGSDIFDFVTEHLTLEESSFSTPTFGAELGINVTSRVDIVFGFDIGKSSTQSEYRAFVDNNLLPIEQTTEMKEFSVFGSVRYSLLPKGRSVSRLAWIPSTVTPYVGGGAGLLNYKFFQTGDFVDFQTNRVFSDVFQSSGWAPSWHILGGADVQVYKHLFVSFEGKYQWSSAELEQKFVDFAPIDLSGARFGAGIHLVF